MNDVMMPFVDEDGFLARWLVALAHVDATAGESIEILRLLAFSKLFPAPRWGSLGDNTQCNQLIIRHISG